MVHDSPDRFGTVTRFLHWSMALLVILQFLKLGDRINDGEHWVGQTIVPLHISVGLLILVLAVVRLIWASRQSGRRPVYPGLLAFMVKAGHFGLYASMFLMPLTGIAVMLGGGYGLNFFGIQLVAQTEIETPWLATLGSLHPPIAWLFVALVVGHIGAALFHHFIKKDATLRRMLV